MIDYMMLNPLDAQGVSTVLPNAPTVVKDDGYLTTGEAVQPKDDGYLKPTEVVQPENVNKQYTRYTIN